MASLCTQTVQHFVASPLAASAQSGNVHFEKPSVKVSSVLSAKWHRNPTPFLGACVQLEKECCTVLHVQRQSLGVNVRAAKRVTSDRSFVLTATLVALEGREEEVQQLCKQVIEWADGLKADKSKGVLQFECSVDAYEKNVFHFWERYSSFPAMNDTRASPEHCKFMNDVRPLLSSPVALAAYEYKDGQIGCMLNPIGPKGEGGLDDATGQGGSGGGASYKQTSQGLQQGIGEREGWGIEKAIELSQAKSAAQDAARSIAEGLKSLFGNNKN
eukprot:TRINITY_DN248_c0_g1_i1.p1 TRINITY_DN248_c0_g1~~TRINITY_DN248_c0_g1_i1.p1  ORF type:complete len:282 (+),score=63.04 TRINITY_DN248_c0_g1_i1:31-846(+)